jgi:hypothetical protein
VDSVALENKYGNLRNILSKSLRCILEFAFGFMYNKKMVKNTYKIEVATKFGRSWNMAFTALSMYGAMCMWVWGTRLHL